MFPVMTVASTEEPPITGRAAIRGLEHHEASEPVFHAGSPRPEELFAAAAIWTGLGLRVFLHG